MSILAFFNDRRYFLRIEVASGLVCQPSSIRGTSNGQALEVICISGLILAIS